MTPDGRTVGGDERLGTLLEGAGPDVLLIVDLNITGADALEAIRLAKARPVPVRVVAFLSHVQVELAATAREAGADEVMARSGFSARLPEILGAG